MLPYTFTSKSNLRYKYVSLFVKYDNIMITKFIKLIKMIETVIFIKVIKMKKNPLKDVNIISDNIIIIHKYKYVIMLCYNMYICYI